MQWGSPPPRERGAQGVWVKRLAPLRERPGEWCKFSGLAAPVANQLSRGAVKGIKAGEFEATYRDNPSYEGRRGDVYVRYVGGES